MPLGSNRDYKKTHTLAAKNLKIHDALMQLFINRGLDKLAASEKAYFYLTHKDDRKSDPEILATIKKIKKEIGEMKLTEAYSEYGVMWTEFDKSSRPIKKQKFFTTEKEREDFVKKIEKKDNFGQILSWSEPETTDESRNMKRKKIREANVDYNLPLGKAMLKAARMANKHGEPEQLRRIYKNLATSDPSGAFKVWLKQDVPWDLKNRSIEDLRLFFNDYINESKKLHEATSQQLDLVKRGIKAGCDDSYMFMEWLVQDEEYYGDPESLENEMDQIVGDTENMWRNNIKQALQDSSIKTLIKSKQTRYPQLSKRIGESRMRKIDKIRMEIRRILRKEAAIPKQTHPSLETVEGSVTNYLSKNYKVLLDMVNDPVAMKAKLKSDFKKLKVSPEYETKFFVGFDKAGSGTRLMKYITNVMLSGMNLGVVK